MQMLQAFEGSKQQMVAITHLAHPGKKAKLALSVDASDTHIGAALQQEASQGSLQPLGFFSRKSNTAEQKYIAFDRELLAVYAAIQHFRWVLEGRRFYVLSDHKPLTFNLHRQSDAWSTRQQRHSPTLLSTNQISGTWLARRMWWLTAYLGPLRYSPCPGLPRWMA